MSNKITRTRTFRFPFDIDRRVFLVLAIIFFILSIKAINNLFFPRLYPTTIASIIQKTYTKQYADFEQSINDLTESDLYHNTISNKKLDELYDKKWSLTVYKQDSMVLWTNSAITALTNTLQPDSLYTFSKNGTTGLLVTKIKKIGGNTYKLVGVFPFYIEYNIKNNFLKPYFTFLSSYDKNAEDFGYRLKAINELTPKNKSGHFVYINNKPRFEIYEKDDFFAITDKNFWNFFFASISFILFGVSMHTYFKVSVKRNKLVYYLVMLVMIVIIRSLNYLFGFPDDYSEFYLFNPELYARGWLNKSLGDVFINSCLLFWIFFFFIMNVQNKVLNIRLKYSKILFLIFFGVLFLLFGYSQLINLHSIITDSTVNFDYTNYNMISAGEIIGLGTLLVIFMNYVLFCIIINKYFEFHFPNTQIKYLIPLASIPFAYWFADPILFESIVYISIWTMLLFIFFNTKFLNTKFDFNSYRLIYWLIFLAFSCVLIINHFDNKKKTKLQNSFAQSILRFENKNTEIKLKQIGDQLSSDTTLNSASLTDVEKNDYLNNYYINKFQNEYKTLGFVISEKTDTNISRDKFELLNKIEALSEVEKVNSNIYLINKAGSEEYIFYKLIGNTTIIINLKPANNNELDQLQFGTTKNSLANKIHQNSDYDFAYYHNDSLLKQTGIHAFPTKLLSGLANKNGKIELKDNNMYEDVIAHLSSASGKKSVIVRKRNNNLYRISTTYAYIFTIFFICITLYILGNILARSNFSTKRFLNLLGLTLRMRIHISILLVEAISLTIIGAITIIVFSNNSKKAALDDSILASEEIRREIKYLDIKSNNVFLSSILSNTDKFTESVNPFLDKHNVSLNLFTLDGKRIFTTVSKNVSKIIDGYINPKANSQLLKNNRSSAIVTQKIGDLDYYTIYSYLRSQNDEVIGIIEIPNFASKQIIRQNNSDIITLLINIYAFVFLLSSLFSYHITRRLTNSFTKIVTQFSKINLTTTNTPLEWPYSDEIGLLIKEYNRTLRKLENSTALLAKSEREIAWREMAKQIAHEIKNPLTPMNLSLQSLQAAIKRKDPNVPMLTQRMTNTVLEQINVLTRTATNFSEFAKMTDIDARRESLIDILESSTGIYSDNHKAEFLFVFPKKDIYVFVDKVKIIRVITNVIQNAIQAIPHDRMGQISLTVTKEAKGLIRISIEDNGEGIPPELGNTIFEPNFTTKSSGSGLGLAMSKEIMLKTGGNIFYDRPEQGGTVFHIDLPEAS